MGLKKSQYSAGAALLVGLILFANCYAFDWRQMLGLGGDSGHGKVAQLEFTLHDDFVVTAIAWSPDGRYIASSGTQTRKLHIWDVGQRKIIKELISPNPPAAGFNNLAWSPDGRYLAICGTFSTSLRIYETQNWHVARDFTHDDGCSVPMFSSDSQEFSGWGANSVVTISVSNWTVIKKVFFTEKYMPSIEAGTYVPKTHTLALSGYRYEKRAPGSSTPVTTGRVWLIHPDDNQVNESICVFCQQEFGHAKQLAFSSDGKQLATSTDFPKNEYVHVLRFPSGEVLENPAIDPSDGSGVRMMYTFDNRYLIVAIGGIYTKHAIYLINAQTLKVTDVVHSANSNYDLAVHPNSQFFAAANGTGITVWSFKN